MFELWEALMLLVMGLGALLIVWDARRTKNVPWLKTSNSDYESGGAATPRDRY
jgi:hypothetical protein